MDQSHIDQIRQRLDDERGHLRSQLDDMGVDPATGAPKADQFEQGFADSGQATAEKARVLSMAEGIIESLREIEAAFERMDAGTYGTCESCGDSIPFERLEARPVVRMCMGCKRKAS